MKINSIGFAISLDPTRQHTCLAPTMLISSPKFEHLNLLDIIYPSTNQALKLELACTKLENYLKHFSQPICVIAGDDSGLESCSKALALPILSISEHKPISAQQHLHKESEILEITPPTSSYILHIDCRTLTDGNATAKFCQSHQPALTYLCEIDWQDTRLQTALATITTSLASAP